MFTSLSNTRKTNLYFIIALAIMLVLILSPAVLPSMAAPKSAVVPVTGGSEYTDYYQRHPELSAPLGMTIDMMRYRTRNQNVSSSTNLTDLSDYFLRHPEFKTK